MCVVFPSVLPEGTIVLKGFVGNPLRYEPGLAQEVEVRDINKHGKIHESLHQIS
jgi:hypothetical protein